MPLKCAVIMCKSTSKKDNNISFFKFPMDVPVILDQWITALNMKNWTPVSSSRICHLHFKSSDFSNATGKILRLKPDVIPTQNLYNASSDKDTLCGYSTENRIQQSDASVCNIDISTSNKAEFIFHSNQNETIQENNVMSKYLTKAGKAQKRESTEILQSVNIKCRKLKKENEELKLMIKSLTQKYEQQLNNQANMFRDLIEKEKINLKQKLIAAQSKAYSLNKKNNRIQAKVKNVLQDLKKSKTMSSETCDMLSSEVNSISCHILENESKNPKEGTGRRYSEDVKRTVFKLPHSSLRNWMSNVNIQPGFQLKVLQDLSTLDTAERDCCLIFDSMAIRQQITWSEEEHRYIGFCDYGNSISIENKDTKAQEALVFLLVSLKGAWKWPIAYFLVKKPSSAILSELIKSALIMCCEHNLHVHSITFDGDTCNCSAINMLGAKIFAEDYTQIKNFFPCPNEETNKNIKVILDPCHMVKLARNALADYKQFESNEGSIKWDYIVRLHTLQKQLTFKLKNRLSSQCINWQQNKMKVKYAVHVLSASVANAIEFLESEGLEEFKGSSATVKFVRAIDTLFDILNSRNPFAKGYKTPIFKKNIEYLRHKTDDIIKYLFSLKTTSGQPLYRTGRKTFIYGLSIAAKSILDVSEKIFENNKSFKYILSYKFSQDHLEILFSKIRGRHGFNNNPTCQQLKYAFRQILLHSDIKQSINSNCFEFDTEYATSIFPIMWKKKQDHIFNDLENENECYSEFQTISLKKHDNISDYIIYYIGGYIVRQLKYLNCESCALSLRHIISEHNYSQEDTFSRFFNYCNNGGLVKSSASVFYICKETEKQLRIVTDYFSILNISEIDKKVLHKVKNILAFDNKIFSNLECKNTGLLEMPHKIQLIIIICNKYIKVRLHSFSKFYHEEILKPIRKRHRLTKQILFLRE